MAVNDGRQCCVRRDTRAPRLSAGTSVPRPETYNNKSAAGSHWVTIIASTPFVARSATTSGGVDRRLAGITTTGPTGSRRFDASYRNPPVARPSAEHIDGERCTEYVPRVESRGWLLARHITRSTRRTNLANRNEARKVTQALISDNYLIPLNTLKIARRGTHKRYSPPFEAEVVFGSSVTRPEPAARG